MDLRESALGKRCRGRERSSATRFASLKCRRASRSTVNAHDQNATASSLVGAPAVRRQTNDGWKRPKNSFRTASFQALRGKRAPVANRPWQVAWVHVAQPVILLYFGWGRRSDRHWDSHAYSGKDSAPSATSKPPRWATMPGSSFIKTAKSCQQQRWQKHSHSALR